MGVAGRGKGVRGPGCWVGGFSFSGVEGEGEEVAEAGVAEGEGVDEKVGGWWGEGGGAGCAVWGCVWGRRHLVFDVVVVDRGLVMLDHGRDGWRCCGCSVLAFSGCHAMLFLIDTYAFSTGLTMSNKPRSVNVVHRKHSLD